MPVSVSAPEILVKQPTEDLLFGCNFTKLLTGSNLLTGVPTVTDSPTAELTLLEIARDATNRFVNVRIQDGIAGGVYELTFTAADDAVTPNTHVVTCFLEVKTK